MEQINKIFFTVILLSLLSCSSAQKSTKKSKRGGEAHAAWLELEFDDIERSKALKKYQKMRWKQWNKYRKGRHRPKKQRVQRTRRRSKNFPKSGARGPILTGKKLESVKREINQNLDFFCMKHRLHHRYKNIDRCNNHTQKIFKGCSKKNDHRLNRVVVRCLKKKLRLR